MCAARMGPSENVRILINAGADLEKRDVDGYTALMYAANADQLECVIQLVSVGAQINARDNDHSIPIMFAAQNGSIDVVRFLLEHRAAPTFEGKLGVSARGFAESNGHQAIVELIKSWL